MEPPPVLGARAAVLFWSVERGWRGDAEVILIFRHAGGFSLARRASGVSLKGGRLCSERFAAGSVLRINISSQHNIMKFAKMIVLGLIAAALGACASKTAPSTATSVPTGGYVQPAK